MTTIVLQSHQFVPPAVEHDVIRLAQHGDQGRFELTHIIDPRQHIASLLQRTILEVQDRITHRTTVTPSHVQLPNEILSEIFTLISDESYHRFHTRPPDKAESQLRRDALVSSQAWARRSPFNVSHVSRRWREIALTTPRLWASLIVDLQKKSPVEMMEHWFACARNIPVQVTLWREEIWARDRYGSISKTIHHMTFNQIVNSIVQTIVIPRIHQIEALNVCCEPEPHSALRTRVSLNQDIAIIFEALKAVPESSSSSLKSFTVDSMDAHLSRTVESAILPTFPSQLFSNLQMLHVRGYIPSTASFTCIPPNLTVLKLDAPAAPGIREPAGSPEFYLNLLKLLPSLTQLQRLRLKGKYAPLSTRLLDPTLQPDELIHLPQLNRLTLIGYACATYASRIVAPNLKTLKLKREGYRRAVNPGTPTTSVHWKGIGTIISSLLERCQGSVTKFTLCGLGGDVSLASWLKSMHGLQHMTVIQDGQLLQSTVEVLSTKSDVQDSWMFCPGLETLEWRSTEPLKASQLETLHARRVAVLHHPKSPITVPGSRIAIGHNTRS